MGTLTPEQSQLPPLSTELEQRLQLMNTADAAVQRAQMLFSPSLEGRSCVVGLKGYAGELRSLCSSYLTEREKRTEMLKCAERLKSLCVDLARADPKIGTPYYLGVITGAADRVLTILSTNTRKQKETIR